MVYSTERLVEVLRTLPGHVYEASNGVIICVTGEGANVLKKDQEYLDVEEVMDAIDELLNS